MGREFLRQDGVRWAYWDRVNDVEMNRAFLMKEDIPAFIEWLQAGPPKPQYRITRTFDFRPDLVRQTGAVPGADLVQALSHDDIEEVPCSG